MGTVVGDWPFIHDDDAAAVASTVDDLLTDRAERNVRRSRNYTKAGGIVHVEWHNSVLRDPDGQLVSIMSLGLDVTERVLLQDRLAHQASRDALTGLPHRALLLERLTQEVARAGRVGATAAVLFLDLDGFRVVNDRLGHAMGDALLIAVAARLHAAIARPILLAAGAAAVGTSLGIALSSLDRSDPESLLADADAAMYRAKQAGKGRYALASSVSAASA